MLTSSIDTEFRRNGFVHVPSFLDTQSLTTLLSITTLFHQQWLEDNQDTYAKGAVNSASLTDGRYLNATAAKTLFELIGSHALVDIVKTVLPKSRTFLNTQLFFNPKDADRHNYWHRDPQYHLDEAQQQSLLNNGPEVVHCRLALKPENGIELIPASHRQWDNAEEREVRLELNGRKNYEALNNGVAVPMQTGDLLVFSANMIHRGLYGLDRFALDILYCEDSPETQGFINHQCLPEPTQLAGIDVPSIFKPKKETR